ncbi:quinone oxidoreductase [soil metagenome]
MRAIVVSKNGGPEELQLTEVDNPKAGPGQVLVEARACGVNFVDIYLRAGVYPTQLPYVPGNEGAGVITAIGEGVVGFAIGDSVAWTMNDGSYAEQVAVSAALAVKIPEGLSFDTAAASMAQGMTAHFLAHSIVPLKHEDIVLVHAGAGGVGLLLTQFLVRQGVRVITTASTIDKAELSLGAGAELVINYTVDDVASRVRDYTEGVGVRVAFDGVGAATFDASLDSIRTRGTLVLFGGASGPVPPFDPQILNQKGSLMLTRPSMGDFIAGRAELEWRSGEVLGLAASGELDVRIGNTYDLADAPRAHEDLAGRRTTGKLLLRP